MKLELNHRPDSLLIHSWALDPLKDGAQSDRERYRIRIADTWYRQSLILTPQAVKLWDVKDLSALQTSHFEQLAELGAEVVIIGTGTRTVFPDAALTGPLMRRRIGLEVMDTAAACRTYNILAADGRDAVAALIV